MQETAKIPESNDIKANKEAVWK